MKSNDIAFYYKTAVKMMKIRDFTKKHYKKAFKLNHDAPRGASGVPRVSSGRGVLG